MRIPFELDGGPAEFHWNNVTGRAKLTVGGQTVGLQSSYAPSSHFSTSLKRVWRQPLGNHVVEIEKLRPLLLAGFRPNSFTVKIDGCVVAQARGL